jgi:hypothetical protein
MRLPIARLPAIRPRCAPVALYLEAAMLRIESEQEENGR